MIQADNLMQMLRQRCKLSSSKIAYQYLRDSQWKSITWKEVDEKVDNISAGLLRLGVRQGHQASILGGTTLNWALSDLAILRCGAASVGVYPTLTGEQSSYVLLKSESTVLFVENPEQLEKIKPWLKELPDLKKVILWQGVSELPEVIQLSQLEEMGKEALKEDPELVKKAEALIHPSDLAILVFTSGTTGPPKAAALTHHNVMSELKQLSFVNDNDKMLFFLPLAHVGERIGGHYNRIMYGVQAAFVEDLTQVIEAIKEIQPTFFGSVPRIFEKIHTKIHSQLENASFLRRKIFRWAVDIGKKAAQKQDLNQPLSFWLNVLYKIADTVVLHRIRNLFGGKVRYCVTSAAPISTEILLFFRAAGIVILEGYGQTETSCFATLNSPENLRFGSVGKPLPDVKIKIAEDGEVLIKGDVVFKGYFGDDEKTKESFDEEGWLRTGDLGSLDKDGYLFITGRKKDIIITSGGKNVTPSNIENLLLEHPLIEQALVHGDRRNYLTALLALAPDSAQDWAKRKNIGGTQMEALNQHPLLLNEIQAHVDEVNNKVARYESIKKFTLLPRLLDIENGELTPTLKIKRNIVEQHYKNLLDAMYEGEA